VSCAATAAAAGADPPRVSDFVDTYRSYRGSTPLIASCIATCSIASSRDSVSGSVCAAAVASVAT
jgi:hypothetical protein